MFIEAKTSKFKESCIFYNTFEIAIFKNPTFLHKNEGFGVLERPKSMNYAIKQTKMTSPIWSGATKPSIFVGWE